LPEYLAMLIQYFTLPSELFAMLPKLLTMLFECLGLCLRSLPHLIRLPVELRRYVIRKFFEGLPDKFLRRHCFHLAFQARYTPFMLSLYVVHAHLPSFVAAIKNTSAY